MLATVLIGILTTACMGVGAVSVPIIIHLLNRRRYRIIPWGAMRFLRDAQRRNTRRLRLEQLILLASRVGVVFTLVLALASVTGWAEKLWHALFPESLAQNALLRPRRHRILVIDGSLSMATRWQGTTIFDRARSFAENTVRQSPSGDAFSLVLMASPPRLIVNDPSEAVSKVAAEINAIRMPHGSADLVATLHTVEGLLQRSPQRFSERVVYFFTDLQRSTWLEQRHAEVEAILHNIQKQAQTVIVDLGRNDIGNLAVTHLELGTPLATTNADTPIRATVHNFGPQAREQVRVELLVGRARTTAADPPFELRVVQQRLVKLSRGLNTLHFAHRFATPGDYAVQIRLEPDSLELDDVRSIIVTVKQEVPVLLVNGKPGGKLYSQATEFLFDSLNPFQEGLIPGNVPARPKKITLDQFADPGLGDLSPYDCVFLCDVPRLSLPEIQRLQGHLQRGGGVVVTLGDNVHDLGACNDSLYRQGKGILPAKLTTRLQAPAGCYFRFDVAGAMEPEANRHPPANLGAAAPHQSGFLGLRPPLDAFADEKDQAGLRAARFHKCVETSLNSHGQPRVILSFLPEGVADDPGKVPQNFPRTVPALIEWQPLLWRQESSVMSPPAGAGRLATQTRGRVLLFTSSVNMDWTNWPALPSYAPFMQELLRYSIAGKLRERSLTVGEPLEEFLATANSGIDVALQVPGQSGLQSTRTCVEQDSHVFRWTDTDVSGIYRVTVGRSPQELLFAVNVPAAQESDLTRTTETDLRTAYRWDFKVHRETSEISEADGAGLHSPSGGQGPETSRKRSDSNPLAQTAKPAPAPIGPRVASCFLLAMLVLMLAEVVLAWRFGGAACSFLSTDQKGNGSESGQLATHRLPFLLRFFIGLTVCGLLCLAGTLVHGWWTGDFLSFLPDATRLGMETGAIIPEWLTRPMDVLGIFSDGAQRALALVPDSPPPAAGESPHWRLAVRSFFVRPEDYLWLALLLSLATVVFLGSIYFKECRSASLRDKLTLLGTRFSLVLLVLAVLVPQLHVTFDRQTWPHIAIVIDDSASMGVVDAYTDAEVHAAVQQLVSSSGKEGASVPLSRLQIAQATLAYGGLDLRKLARARKAKIHLYRCSGRAIRIREMAAEETESALADILNLRAAAENDASRLGSAVREVLNDFRGTSLSAIVMLTDGITTEGEDLVQVSRYALQRGVPLYLVGIGSRQPPRDLILHDLQVEDTVTVNDRIIFEARLTGHGYPGRVVPVRLREKGSNRILAEESITIDPQGKPAKVRLVHQPAAPGEMTYVLDVPVLPDETRADNNSLERTILVQEPRLTKVLYVEGRPRWEFRYLKALLERESGRDRQNRTIDLKVLLTEGDADWPATDKSAITAFPTKTELNGFDVVVLGDVDPGHPKLGEKHLNNLADFVRQRGGGLLMIAGDRFAPHAYRLSALHEILPLELSAKSRSSAPMPMEPAAYRLRLTPRGRSHPIFRFSPDEQVNDSLWAELKEMYWSASGFRAKPAAEILAVHPQEPEHSPLVVQHFVGAGRCMFFGFDESWRWRWRDQEARFNHFWMQTIRHLARSHQGRVELRLDRQTPYRRGEPIRVRVRFPDDALPLGKQTRVRVVAERKLPGGQATEVQTLTLARIEGSGATYETVMTQTPEGSYCFWLSESATPVSADRGKSGRPQVHTRVLAPPGEMEQIMMNQADMERAALQSEGRYYTLATVGQLIDHLPAGSHVTLSGQGRPWEFWSHVFPFLLAMFLLTNEWVLRKRLHLP